MIKIQFFDTEIKKLWRAMNALRSFVTENVTPQPGGSPMVAVANRTELRTLAGMVNNEVRLMRDLVVQGDRNGGFYFFSETDTRADDGIDIIKPNDAQYATFGRWNRQ